VTLSDCSVALYQANADCYAVCLSFRGLLGLLCEFGLVGGLLLTFLFNGKEPGGLRKRIQLASGWTGMRGRTHLFGVVEAFKVVVYRGRALGLTIGLSVALRGRGM